MGKWSELYQGRTWILFLAFIMVAAYIPAGDAHGAGTLLKTGNYYYSPAPDGGHTPDDGATGSGTGYADYINASGDYVEWTVDASAAERTR
ncbi:hypothetical protein AB6A23_14965 [Paenibacillus tarimensis]